MGSQSCSICLYCGFFPIIACEVCTESLPAILCFRHGPDTLGRRLVWIRGGPFRDGSRHTRRHYSSPGQAPGGFCRFLKRKCKWGRHFLQDGGPCQPRTSWKRRTGKAVSESMAGPCCADGRPAHGELQDSFPPTPNLEPQLRTSPACFTGGSCGAEHTSAGFKWDLDSVGAPNAIL